MHFPELRTEQAEGEESDFSGPEEARKSKPLFLQQKAVSVTLSWKPDSHPHNSSSESGGEGVKSPPATEVSIGNH